MVAFSNFSCRRAHLISAIKGGFLIAEGKGKRSGEIAPQATLQSSYAGTGIAYSQRFR